MRSTIPRLGAVLVSLGLVLAACGGTTSTASQPGGVGERGYRREVSPFAGSAASAPATTARRRSRPRGRSSTFNATHPNINLELEVVDYDSAFDAMSVEVAGGNAPDIVGPVGVSGSEAFHGQWLDLTDLIEANNYDLTQFTEGSVEFYNVGGEGQVGLPFAIYPSMFFYQRDMFDEADLEYPPHVYGEPYVLDGEEVEWDMDAMWEVAKRLTVDVNGNTPNDADFDPTQIEQYGYEPTFQDLRAIGSYYGSGSLVAEDGATAQLPEHWRAAWIDLYEKTYTDHVIMTEALRDAASSATRIRSKRVAQPPCCRTCGTRAVHRRLMTMGFPSIPTGTSRRCRPTTARRPRTSTPTPSGSGARPSIRRRRSRS